MVQLQLQLLLPNTNWYLSIYEGYNWSLSKWLNVFLSFPLFFLCSFASHFVLKLLLILSFFTHSMPWFRFKIEFGFSPYAFDAAILSYIILLVFDCSSFGIHVIFIDGWTQFDSLLYTFIEYRKRKSNIEHETYNMGNNITPLIRPNGMRMRIRIRIESTKIERPREGKMKKKHENDECSLIKCVI